MTALNSTKLKITILTIRQCLVRAGVPSSLVLGDMAAILDRMLRGDTRPMYLLEGKLVVALNTRVGALDVRQLVQCLFTKLSRFVRLTASVGMDVPVLDFHFAINDAKAMLLIAKRFFQIWVPVPRVHFRLPQRQQSMQW
jgi:hypothetical protein